MKYGVIICPKCGNARGVETARKTVTCQCGRQIKLRRMKTQYQTDSPLELAETVQKVNASLRGSGPMPKDRRSRKNAPSVAIEMPKGVKDSLERMRIMIGELAKKKPEFTAEDLMKMSSQLGGGSPDKLIERLMASGVIYEVAPGRFKLA